MNRASALLFAVGTAISALAGCVATPATGDQTGESQDALTLGALASSTSLAQSSAATSVTSAAATSVAAPTKAELTSSAFTTVVTRPTVVPPAWQSPYAKSCAPYDTYTAALAEFTIACTGTIGPDSFAVEQGYLRRKFERCQTKGGLLGVTLHDVDDLLKLQEDQFANDLVRAPDGVRPMTLRECYVRPWEAWLAENFADGTNPCPNWYQLSADPSSDLPTPEGIARWGKLLPNANDQGVIEISRDAAIRLPAPKENFFYAVRFLGTAAVDARAKCGTAETCGNLCSNGLEGFYLDTKKVSVELPTKVTYEGLAIVGDPLWWLDPTAYAAGTSPYLAADYYHPMSFYRALPGARYAHRNRAGERCSYYCEPYHMIGILVADCVDPLDPTTCSMSHCDPAPGPAPGPSSGAASPGSGSP
jgi:hypothetical protein